MTQAHIFARDDGTYLFRTESGDIKNLREIGLEERGTVDLYDADVSRLNEYFYYIHMAVRKYSEELSPKMQEYVIPLTADLIKSNLSPKQWLEFQEGSRDCLMEELILLREILYDICPDEDEQDEIIADWEEGEEE